jgi:AhpD family alkylhydroperoxidase
MSEADQQFEAFKARREAGNRRVLDTGHLGVKRFFRLDVEAYADRSGSGGLDTKTKELLGLVGSAVLRCDDCVDYHIEQCAESGASREEIIDAMNVALIVGGSIVIPHFRHAMATLDHVLPPAGGGESESNA